MRPLELKLRNFRSFFGDGASFDFRRRHLVAIVGPIGSGKSSILDAISFALYGKTPTIASATKSLIHQRASEATVSLRFQVEGEVWEAVRMLRRKGASQHALYRYEQDDGEPPVETVNLESEVNARVVALLGLEFDAFSRSVLLAQGRFAAFLRSRPGERDKVLKGVFGHDRIDVMRDIARAKAREAGLDAEKLAVRIEQLGRLEDEIGELKSQLVSAGERLAVLRKVEPEYAAFAEAITATATAAAEAEQRLAELTELGERFPDPERSNRIIADAQSAGTGRERLALALETAREQLLAADRSLAEAKEAGVPALLDEAAAHLATLGPLRATVDEAGARRDRIRSRLESQRSSAKAALGAVAVAKEALAKSSAAAEAASGDLDQATGALHEARHTEMAAALRSGLAESEPCPVCAQEVTELPPELEAPGLEKAQNEHASAGRRRDETEAARRAAGEEHATAVQAQEAAVKAVAGLEEEAAAAKGDVEAAGAAVTEVEAALTALLGEGAADDLLTAKRREHEELVAASVTAREAVDRARSEHDQAIRDEQAAGKALSALRVDLVDLAARIGTPTDTAELDPQGVASQLSGLVSAWEDAVKAGERAKHEAAEAGAKARSGREALLTSVGVEGDLTSALSEVTARSELLQADLDRREAELRDGAALIAEHASVAAVQATHERIASDLTDARFVRYLLDDERARLAALGSEHFLELSSGRYLFSGDGKFDIVDQTAAEAVRKADSLSGGETFLASLALALSLAEMVTRSGGRLDAFFLDEGFGSLDPEHLDLAMEGIESLVADGAERLVVVVSHVPEMRDRVEDLIILDRGAATGDTIIRQA